MDVFFRDVTSNRPNTNRLLARGGGGGRGGRRSSSAGILSVILVLNAVLPFSLSDTRQTHFVAHFLFGLDGGEVIIRLCYCKN